MRGEAGELQVPAADDIHLEPGGALRVLEEGLPEVVLECLGDGRGLSDDGVTISTGDY